MIDRGNRKLVKAYLTYLEEVRQLSRKSVRLHETQLRHLLTWAGEVPFRNIHRHKPAFPQYMLTARNDGKEGRLSNEYITKVIREAKRFLEWLSVHKSGYKNITQKYLDLMQPPRFAKEPRKREYVSEEEIHRIAEVNVSNMKERRIRAALVFLWLTGIRAGAFVTLPLKAVDLENLEIKVFQAWG